MSHDWLRAGKRKGSRRLEGIRELAWEGCPGYSRKVQSWTQPLRVEVLRFGDTAVELIRSEGTLACLTIAKKYNGILPRHDDECLPYPAHPLAQAFVQYRHGSIHLSFLSRDDRSLPQWSEFCPTSRLMRLAVDAYLWDLSPAPLFGESVHFLGA